MVFLYAKVQHYDQFCKRTFVYLTFCNCSSLTTITISEGVTSIGRYAFAYCTSLTSITIPEGMTSIQNNAFEGCSNLKSIKVLATTPPAAASNSFSNDYVDTLYVPKEAVSTYQNTAPWSKIETIIGF
ncbi:MAG: leucine-rich repeat domain-containing protein [Bacteroidaceae bacterium]|nr:leucine-rich repeat domain-containing protein [Bacteroidaceae bacterium]